MSNNITIPPPEEREAIGKTLDPAELEVDFDYGYVLDPYGEDPDLPEEAQVSGRNFYAVDRKRGILLYFHDLPDATVEALRDMNNLDEEYDRLRKVAAGLDERVHVYSALSLAYEDQPFRVFDAG